MTEFPLGQPLVVDATFTVAGVPTDPTSIVFTIEEPDGDILTFNWPPAGAITKVTTGIFKGQVTPTKLGAHAYRMVAAGAAAGVLEDTFTVVSVIDGGLDFIFTPDDYEGVRMLLGVTELDVANSVIEVRPFGPIAEASVKGEIEDWATVLADALGVTPTAVGLLRWQWIVAAAQYLTASLIANTMARGGFVGLVRGEGQRSPNDWKSYAAELWTLGQQYIEQGKDTTGDIDIDELFYGFPMMITAGPTKKKERNSAWALTTW